MTSTGKKQKGYVFPLHRLKQRSDRPQVHESNQDRSEHQWFYISSYLHEVRNLMTVKHMRELIFSF